MRKTVMSGIYCAQDWNKKGDDEFDKGNFSEALSHYTNALKLEENNTYKGMYYRNRSAVYLELHDYEKVVEDCNSALKMCCNKALYCRCKALEALRRFQEAYWDAEIIISSDPDNEDFQRIAERSLHKIVQERKDESSHSAKVSEMLDLAFDMNASEKKREIAMNHLHDLAYDEVSAEDIFKKEGVSKIAQLVKVEKNEKILCSAIRIVGKLCENNISRTESVMKSVGLLWFLEIMNSTSIKRVSASRYSLQKILNTYSGVTYEFDDSKPDEAWCAAHKKEIDTILLCLSNSITSRMITGLAGNAIIELIMCNVRCVTNNLDWAKRFAELRGVQKLMVSEMLDLAFDVNASEEKRKIAMNNLLELACLEQRFSAEEVFKQECVSKIARLVTVETNEEIICSAIRIVGKLCINNISRTESVMKSVGLLWFLEIMNSTSIKRVSASRYSLQKILNTYRIMDNEPDSNRNEDLCEAYNKEIDTILLRLSYSITSRTITGLARDEIIQLITYNVLFVTTDWAKRFVELRGVQRLMEIASEMEEYNSESLLDITSSTRTITSKCLTMVYTNVYENCDDEKTFTNAVDEFIEDKLHSSDIESKVRVVVAITTLLLGPSDVGNAVVHKEKILEMIFVMAETDDILQQKVALECIVAAVTRLCLDKVDAIINQGVNTLKKLCQSKDDSIRVRALVGLCKLGNSGDSDPTNRPFADGVTTELAEACRRLLVNPNKKIREWAIKGLSYLTFDAGVEVELSEDQNNAIHTMIELAKTNESRLYHVLMPLVNLCNAYDEQEPEMIELTKFVNFYFSHFSEIDDDFDERLDALREANVISVLVNLAKTNGKELLARVFNALCNEQSLRQIVVYENGTEALLSLALDGTVNGKKLASQALVYLALTIHPEVIIRNQLIITDVVQPIVNLLNLECSVNENCQTLTALCNLAEVDDSTREDMFKEGIFQKIEAFVNDENYLLRLASANLINILILSREVAIQYFEQDNSRVEYLMSLYKDENQDIKFAAAAALVKLTVANKEACKKVFDSNFWLEFLRSLLTNQISNVQEIGIIFVLSMIRSMEDVAAKLIETDIMELLRALNKKSTVQNKNIKELTSIALEAVAERSNKEALFVIRWERDTARRLGQLDLLNHLEIKLWVYEHTENLVPLNIYSEFGRILTGR